MSTKIVSYFHHLAFEISKQHRIIESLFSGFAGVKKAFGEHKETQVVKNSALFMGHPVMRVVIMQLATFIVISLVLAGWQKAWGLASMFGGLAAWLPGTLFLLLTLREKPVTVGWSENSTKTTTDCGADKEKWISRIAWRLAFGEALKMLVSFALLILALMKLHTAIAPLLVGWLSVLVVQLLAPILINNRQTTR